MRLRVRLIGTGKENDAFRVNLPTYQLIYVDYDKAYAIVDISDDVHGVNAEALKSETLVSHETGDHYETLHPTLIDSIHRHFDNYYREHKGEFKVELVK
jgi:hypothetical protein